MARATVVLALAGATLAGAAALIGAGCSGDDGEPATAARRTGPPACPQPWRPGWQRLANRIDAPVFCPTWMPNPLTAQIGGEWDNGVSVDRDRSYLVSFLWHEAGNDVHVNLRGYPGSTQIPRCEDVQTVKGKTHRRPVPCFSDPQGTRRIGRFRATLYTANRDVDQWHLLYAWRHGGTLYTLSEHVAPPFSLGRVHRNLERMLRTLAVVRPSG